MAQHAIDLLLAAVSGREDSTLSVLPLHEAWCQAVSRRSQATSPGASSRWSGQAAMWGNTPALPDAMRLDAVDPRPETRGSLSRVWAWVSSPVA
jgi:hypothetical protein